MKDSHRASHTLFNLTPKAARNILGRFVSSVSDFYKDINPATLSGAIDVVVVEDEKGNLSCSPFHVRFGKFKVFKTQDKAVNVCVNGAFSQEVRMKIGEAGEAFFVQETTETIPVEFQTSPLIQPLDGNNLGESRNRESSEPPKLDLGPALSDSELMDTTTKASFVTSENEFRLAGGLGTCGNLSDSEMLLQPAAGGASPSFSFSATTTTMSSSSNNKWDWEWGDFPHKEEASPIVSMSVPVSPLPSFDTPPGRNAVQQQEQAEGEYFIKLLLEEEYFASSCEYFHLHVDQIVSGKCLVSACATARVARLEAIEQVFLAHLKPWGNSPNVTAMIHELFNDHSLVVKLGQFYLPAQAVFVIITGMMFGKKKFSPTDLTKISMDCKRSCHESFGDEFFASEVSEQPATSASKAKHISRFWSRGRTATPKDHSGSHSPVPVSDSESDFPPRSPTPIRTQKQPIVLKVPKISYLKTLRLTSSQLKSLKLHHGENSVQFSLSSNPAVHCSAKIFLWRDNVKIVISDIDGTITKSDALGHLFTFVGKDWTHAGVANLYTLIRDNGYHFMYLTSRALGQASSTREYLSGVDQNRYQLPIGPVIMSPDRLFAAFHREMILKRPEEFKIIALKDIKRLFKTKSPFFAGFGNKNTDVISYRAVDIPASKIFVINPIGDVSVNNMSLFYTTSYTKLVSLVEQIFPPISGDDEDGEFFNDFHYWRQPIASLQSLERSMNRHSIVSDAAARTEKNFKKQQLESEEEEEEEPFV